MNRMRVATLLVLAITALTTRAQDGWLLFRGDAQRTGAAAKQKTWDKRVAWRRPLLMDKLEKFPDADPDEAVVALIKKLRKDADPAILPGSFPLIVNGFCIYRNYRGLCNAALRDFSIKDEESGKVAAYRPSHIVWKSVPHDSALAVLLEKNRTKADTAKVVAMLRADQRDRWVWGNPMIGSLSSDGATVFAIDDFVFPPLSELVAQLVAPPKPFVEVEMKVKPSPLILQNNLYAYDVTSGKLVWDRVDFAEYKKTLERTHFLGAPLPIDKKLYVLTEKCTKDLKQGSLQLLALGFDRKKWKYGDKIEISKALELLKIPGPDLVINAPLRRTQPLHIAQAGELLVCPTNAGVLVGVDRAKLALRWQYRYRAEKTAAPKLPLWQAACPIVTKDRIVFTAADAPDIHCVGFDGKKKWVAEPDGDLYLATVHDSLVLLVGKTHCRALSLVDGKVKWRIRVGHPAGVGVIDGSSYYVPIKDDPKGPAIWEIDIAKGKKLRRIAMPYPDALGNLALHRGMLVSQSVTHIAAFPLGK